MGRGESEAESRRKEEIYGGLPRSRTLECGRCRKSLANFVRIENLKLPESMQRDVHATAAKTMIECEEEVWEKIDGTAYRVQEVRKASEQIDNEGTGLAEKLEWTAIALRKSMRQGTPCGRIEVQSG